MDNNENLGLCLYMLTCSKAMPVGCHKRFHLHLGDNMLFTTSYAQLHCPHPYT